MNGRLGERQDRQGWVFLAGTRMNGQAQAVFFRSFALLPIAAPFLIYRFSVGRIRRAKETCAREQRVSSARFSCRQERSVKTSLLRLLILFCFSFFPSFPRLLIVCLSFFPLLARLLIFFIISSVVDCFSLFIFFIGSLVDFFFIISSLVDCYIFFFLSVVSLFIT